MSLRQMVEWVPQEVNNSDRVILKKTMMKSSFESPSIITCDKRHINIKPRIPTFTNIVRHPRNSQLRKKKETVKDELSDLPPGEFNIERWQRLWPVARLEKARLRNIAIRRRKVEEEKEHQHLVEQLSYTLEEKYRNRSEMSNKTFAALAASWAARDGSTVESDIQKSTLIPRPPLTQNVTKPSSSDRSSS